MPHWEIGAELGILDTERAVKISGAMFVMYRGWGARLLRALVQLSLDRNADAYEEIRPPTLVRTETMVSTGHLPKFDEDAYHVERDDLWAIPTAEVPLTSLHRDEILDEADLPLRYCAYTSVLPARGGLRRPRHARPAARPTSSTRSSCSPSPPTPTQAIACQEDILARSEALLARPRPHLPRARPVHRRPRRLAPPAPGTSRRTRPGCDLWLEVSSVSWFADYQARRASIRWRPTTGPQGHRGVPHGQRLGHGLAPHRRRLPRDPPPARRQASPSSTCSGPTSAASTSFGPRVVAGTESSSNQTALPSAPLVDAPAVGAAVDDHHPAARISDGAGSSAGGAQRRGVPDLDAHAVVARRRELDRRAPCSTAFVTTSLVQGGASSSSSGGVTHRLATLPGGTRRGGSARAGAQG